MGGALLFWASAKKRRLGDWAMSQAPQRRTAAEVRAAFTKNGGALGETNSVSFMFSRIGYIVYPASVADTDAMFEAAVEAGDSRVGCWLGSVVAPRPDRSLSVSRSQP
jgi:hypothetical protein